MPFKTKAKKEKASARWATFVEGARSSYISVQASKESENSSDKEQDRGNRKILEKTYVVREIVKIALMALLVIGLQIILKISHIGF